MFSLEQTTVEYIFYDRTVYLPGQVNYAEYSNNYKENICVYIYIYN